jgi:hypothetical protein
MTLINLFSSDASNENTNESGTSQEHQEPGELNFEGFRIEDPSATPSTVESAPVVRAKCPGCMGKGRYVGLSKVEDPCQVCGGSGEVNPDPTPTTGQPF